MTERRQNIDVRIDVFEKNLEPAFGYTVVATVNGKQHRLIFSESASGALLHEFPSADTRRLGRAACTKLLHVIEERLGKPVAIRLTRQQLKVANQLVYRVLAARAAVEKPKLLAEALQDLTAFRQKYRREIGAHRA
jgi:hypothetical protein